MLDNLINNIIIFLDDYSKKTIIAGFVILFSLIGWGVHAANNFFDTLFPEEDLQLLSETGTGNANDSKVVGAENNEYSENGSAEVDTIEVINETIATTTITPKKTIKEYIDSIEPQSEGSSNRQHEKSNNNTQGNQSVQKEREDILEKMKPIHNNQDIQKEIITQQKNIVDQEKQLLSLQSNLINRDTTGIKYLANTPENSEIVTSIIKQVDPLSPVASLQPLTVSDSSLVSNDPSATVTLPVSQIGNIVIPNIVAPLAPVESLLPVIPSQDNKIVTVVPETVNGENSQSTHTTTTQSENQQGQKQTQTVTQTTHENGGIETITVIQTEISQDEIETVMITETLSTNQDGQSQKQTVTQTPTENGGSQITTVTQTEISEEDTQVVTVTQTITAQGDETREENTQIIPTPVSDSNNSENIPPVTGPVISTLPNGIIITTNGNITTVEYPDGTITVTNGIITTTTAPDGTVTTTDGTITTTTSPDGTITTTNGKVTTTIYPDGTVTTTDGVVTTTTTPDGTVTSTNGIITTTTTPDGTITSTDGNTITIIPKTDIYTIENNPDNNVQVEKTIEIQPNVIDSYFNNSVTIPNAQGEKKLIKIATQSNKSPLYPIPASCPKNYSQIGIYSNIFSISTVKIPYNDVATNTSIHITNEFISDVSGTIFYYKVFNVNGEKIGGVTYKTQNPDFDYYRVFTLCLAN